MAIIPKNITDWSFFDFADSNIESTCTNVKGGWEEAEEKQSLSIHDDEVFGIVLSGEKSNTVGGDGTVPNQPFVVTLGDGIDRLAMRVRLEKAEGEQEATDTFLLENPFSPYLTDIEKQEVVRMHPLAYTMQPYKTGMTYNYGDTVSIQRQRGKLFVTRNHMHKYGTLGGATGTGTGDENYNFDSSMLTAPKVVSAIPASGMINFTIDDYKKIAATNCLKPLMDFIGQHEGGKGGYNGYNSCKNGAGGGSSQDADVKKLVSAWGKKFTEMTISEVRNTQIEPRKVAGVHNRNCTVFAVGKYQWIPKTFKSMLTRVDKLNTGHLFDQPMQDALAMYLVFWKRYNQVGKYFLGMHNNIIKCQLGVAQEWASMPVLAATTRKGVHIPKGAGYYGGVGINPSKMKISRMKTLNKLLVETRACVLASDIPNIALARRGGK